MTCPTCMLASTPGIPVCPRCGTPLAPPQGWYGAPHAMSQPSPVGQLGTATTILLGCVAAGAAVDALSGDSVTPITVLTLLLQVALIPVFLVWFYRVRKNAGLWGDQSRRQGWAVAAWVTPVVNFWFPVQIMRDAWRSSTTDAAAQRRVAQLAGAWWACWVLTWITGIHRTRSTTVLPDGTTVVTTQFGSFLGGTVPSAVFEAAAAVFLILVVTRISRMQETRIAGRG